MRAVAGQGEGVSEHLFAGNEAAHARGAPFGFGGVAMFDAGSMSDGPSGDQAAAAWRAVQQLVIGDDWAGLAVGMEEIQGAWGRCGLRWSTPRST